MPGPKAPEIVLSGDERAALERLARAHTTGQQLANAAFRPSSESGLGRHNGFRNV